MIGIQNILVATDFGEPAAAALRYGEELSRKFGATLHVLNVVETASQTPATWAPPRALDDAQRSRETDAMRTLEALVSEPERTARGIKLVTLTSPVPTPAILSYARDAGIDLIIVGTHRDGLSHFFLGSVAQQVSRSAACPVLTTRNFSAPGAGHFSAAAGSALKP